MPTITAGNGSLDRASLAAAARALARRDSDLARIMKRHGPPPLWARPPGFATLARIILEQQVSLASARAMYRRLAGTVPEVTPAAVLRLGVAGLQGIGFTRQKARYAHELAEHVVDGTVPLSRLGRLSDDAVRETLMRVPGIGAWTASIYLLMALRRPDVWPPGDLALHKALAGLEGLREPPTTREAEELADRWRPLRAVAARILWHGYLSSRPAPGRRVATAPPGP